MNHNNKDKQTFNLVPNIEEIKQNNRKICRFFFKTT
jgi:hypothetical protein